MSKGAIMITATIGVAARKAAWTAGVAAVGVSLTLGFATGLARADDTTAGGMYGDPAAAAPYWREQSYDDCALMATADVIGQETGHQISEQEIIAVAHALPSQSHPGPIYTLPKDMNDPVNSGDGTDPRDLPVLMAHYHVAAILTNKSDAATTGVATGMAALKHYLAGGRKVIVEVNGELVWGEPVQTKGQERRARLRPRRGRHGRRRRQRHSAPQRQRHCDRQGRDGVHRALRQVMGHQR
jgi:hypothetical protein